MPNGQNWQNHGFKGTSLKENQPNKLGLKSIIKHLKELSTFFSESEHLKSWLITVIEILCYIKALIVFIFSQQTLEII